MTIDTFRQAGGDWPDYLRAIRAAPSPLLAESIALTAAYRTLLDQRRGLLVWVECDEATRQARLNARATRYPSRRIYDDAAHAHALVRGDSPLTAPDLDAIVRKALHRGVAGGGRPPAPRGGDQPGGRISLPAAKKRRPSPRERGYGERHRRLRTEWAREVKKGTVRCARCGKFIAPDADWDLGHDDHNRSKYKGPEHATCNRRAAGQAARAAQLAAARPRRTSRRW
jgi:hypothetical protein